MKYRAVQAGRRLVLAENVAYADQRFNLSLLSRASRFLGARSEHEQQRSLEHLATVGSEDYENDALIGLSPLDESSFLHARELVRQAAFSQPIAWANAC